MRNRYLTLILAVGVLSIPIGRVAAQETSTPGERTQWVEVTHKLESAPLDESVNKQGEAHSNGSVMCTMSTCCCVRLY
jgi:hypothetical protein